MTLDPAWEETHRDRLWGVCYDPRLMVCVWRQYAISADRSQLRFVDIGCGVGAQAHELARLGYSVLGIDGSPSAIERALTMRSKILENSLAYCVGDVTVLGGPDNHVDCITDAACLECMTLEDATKALLEAARVLRPDGSLFSIHKTDQWQHADLRGKIGTGSRGLSLAEAWKFYGTAFARVGISLDTHVDGFGQQIPEWIVECREPRK